MINFVKHKKIFISISIILCLLSLSGLIFWGLKSGIDFKGGSLLEVEFPQKKENREIKEKLNSLDLGLFTIQASGEKRVILKMKEIDENKHQEILKTLEDPEEIRFSNIGPIISQELIKKAWGAIILAVILIIFYIAIAFRKISRLFGAAESWRWGLGATLALGHDILIMLGLFAFLGFFKGTEIDVNFVTAILVVLGYSVNDTIVIYDRIRENLLFSKSNDFPLIVNQSLNDTLLRCLNTTLTTIVAVLAVYLFAGSSIRDFALAMMVGVSTGAWSSWAVATPFLLWRRKTAPVKIRR
ncbi:protein translocase subunit SecF [Candidatus Jorgensenbacteria bacterium CG11_big_fil_rev_8_21_14_0_20_38_23]|uniref:Protein-export membrane protein SecF n=1 Tax=Candidatus Jorgensenbacteria bacterium CG11_big_fil_rev_8_21_14_0_20_38_23 TaxID=1974594 RepID=A0A2H0NE55_9BACT|nr:MAG: protein translocase subunit SecF [Candidatus Jorgensenbacteria bacterium CG11_big_fil_rev_8_21_14_0_20_38_23]